MFPEYIDDKALEDAALDDLHHSGIAEELFGLVKKARTPLNVAVYGRWGAGKSTIGLFLRDMCDRPPSIGFIAFDAWKYAKESLQRSFILAAATSLDLNVKNYRQRLYTKSRHTKFSASSADVAMMILVFLAVLVGLLCITLLVALVASIARETDFASTTVEVVSKGIAQLILSATFLTAAAAIAGRLFTTDVEESEVGSDEAFVEVFEGLVDEARQKGFERLVFFIDELDRCPPKRVVSVLETIRTFMDVQGCIYIVAADHQALDQALTLALDQAVPLDRECPYYSSGSEYLDKVFQHQLAIPPLHGKSLTSFAQRLVVSRAGVWSDLPDVPTLVSVLVPSHVRSPRRVKVLLNSFASTFHVMASRHEESTETTPDPVERCLELAKLTTLRLEFPVFFRVVEHNPRLVTYLTEYVLNDGVWPEGAEKEAAAFGLDSLVPAYAQSLLPVAALLPSEPMADSDEPEQDEQSTPGGSKQAVVQAIVSDELLSYLRRTAFVPGPVPDMVYVESQGSVFGLPADLADLIEIDAVNNDYKSVATRISSIGDERAPAVIRLLLSFYRELSGAEALNSVGIALRLIDDGVGYDQAIANEATAVALSAQAAGSLKLEWFPGVVRVALRSRSHEAPTIVAAVLADPGLRELDSASIAAATVSALGESLHQFVPDVRALVLDRDSGWIEELGEGGLNLSGLVLVVADALPGLTERWRESDEPEADVADFSTCRDLTEATEEVELMWELLRAAVEARRADLVDQWLELEGVKADKVEQTDLLLQSTGLVTFESWSRVASAMNGAPATSDPAAFEALACLFVHLSENGGWSQHDRDLFDALKSVWARPAVPQGWDDEMTALLLESESWHSAARKAKHEAIHELAELDRTPAQMGSLLARSYVGAMRAQPPLPEQELVEVVEGCVADRQLIGDKAVMWLVEAIQESNTMQDAARTALFMGLMGSLEGTGKPPAWSDIEGHVQSSPSAELLIVRYWLRRGRITRQDLTRFLKRVDNSGLGLNLWGHSFTVALRHVGSDGATAVVQELCHSSIEFTNDLWKSVLAVPLDQLALARYLSEQLRTAGNEESRARWLKLWNAWRPTDPGARRLLVDAFMAMIQTGKGSFSLGLKYLSLVSSPPKGMKRDLVSRVETRAKALGLVRETGRALEQNGLKASKGFLRRLRP